VGVVAVDPDGEALTYTWSKFSGPGSVVFTPNNLAQMPTSSAAFGAAGTYVLRVTVADGHGGSAVSEAAENVFRSIARWIGIAVGLWFLIQAALLIGGAA
jgi:hypothetical protein